jgi:hypothetical protein
MNFEHLADKSRPHPTGRRSRPRSQTCPAAHENVAARRRACLDDLVGGGSPAEQA